MILQKGYCRNDVDFEEQPNFSYSLGSSSSDDDSDRDDTRVSLIRSQKRELPEGSVVGPTHQMDELDGMIGPTRPFRELDRQMGELDIVVGPTRPFDELDGMIGHVQLAKWASWTLWPFLSHLTRCLLTSDQWHWKANSKLYLVSKDGLNQTMGGSSSTTKHLMHIDSVVTDFDPNNFQRYNEAALAKLSWRILENPKSLLSKSLKGKYFPEGDILSCEVVSAISHGWRSVLQKRPYGPAPEAFADLTVADLRVNQHEDWDTEKIRRILPQYEEDILAIKPSNENALDRQVWLVAPKVKMFAWKALKRAVPVGERLVERHVDVDPRCKRCRESKSIIHLFFHCRFAQQVWRDAPLALGFDPRGIVDLESRWTALCATPCLPPTGLATSQLFPWILWKLWKERNRFVFNGCSASPEDTLATAIRSAKEWEQGHMIEKSTPPRSLPVTKETHTAATIVRSDAAWRKEDKKAGLGWTVKTSRFEIRMKKTQWHVSSPLIAEGLAIREAMLFCREHGLDNILLECDSS
ncbi:hypothetical protein DY000_02059004 [Brassica cretica]|uniref:Reverse transcriptase zinc-binding domain-containing protein n=1 Tax=Brassica cretica TaxID=69181 RepID=A0ABQ7AZL9_BRACR|nr:hypothetical protein DY000_02059004 [Brassica cretica]